MLSAEENQTLTQVGPGTPMGNLLRHYWHPVAAEAELEQFPTRAIRLLGEDLVLYRGEGGRHHLLSLYCAHRSGDLSQGIVEGDSLRCARHGWLYDERGQCIDQPLEEHPFSDEVQVRAYPVEAKAGMIWVYLGPQPAPLVPDWEPFGWQDGLVQVVFSFLECNWLQCQENSLDPDSEWLQAALDRSGDRPAGPPPSEDQELDFEEFEYGFVYRHAPQQRGSADGWAIGRTSIWPNAMFEGDERSCHFEWYVPIDDRRTLALSWFIDRVAPGASVDDLGVRHWRSPVQDEKGEYVTTHRLNRKHVMWLTQGMIVDRTNEHLMEADRGVVMLRNKLFSQIALIADGGEPKATLRDASANRRLPLPQSHPDPAGEEFTALAGQPDEVAELRRRVIETWQQTP